MSRYIDADKLVEFCDEMSRNNWNQRVSPVSWADAYESFIDDIDEQPTADVVEVVRCKDCKWWKRMNGDKRLQCFHGHGLIRTTENDYCSRGERREKK